MYDARRSPENRDSEPLVTGSAALTVPGSLRDGPEARTDKDTTVTLLELLTAWVPSALEFTAAAIALTLAVADARRRRLTRSTEPPATEPALRGHDDGHHDTDDDAEHGDHQSPDSDIAALPPATA